MGQGLAFLEDAKFGRVENSHGTWERWYNNTGAAIAAGVKVYKFWTSGATGIQMKLVEIADDGTNPDMVFGVVDGQMKSTQDAPTCLGEAESASWCWVKLEGYCTMSNLVAINGTAGHALKVHNRACVTQGAADAGAANEFAVLTTTANSTTQPILLKGGKFTTTT